MSPFWRPRFRNPERILSLGSPHKSLHEKLIRPNPHEIFAGIDWSACKGFVCKSFSEDDIHKSIKYGKRSSTPRGNAKLSEAFRQQQLLHLNKSCNGGNYLSAGARGGEGGRGLSVISNGSKVSKDINGAVNENRSIGDQRLTTKRRYHRHRSKIRLLRVRRRYRKESSFSSP